MHPNTKQVIAAYEDPRYGGIRELPLPRCVEIWGWNPAEADLDDSESEGSPRNNKNSTAHTAVKEVRVLGSLIFIPRVSRKFINFVRSRRSIYREIQNMSKLKDHINVLKLDEVLELVQDTKSTIFLILELAAGGELFDRIQIDRGTEEDTALAYFKQLLSGVAHCHKAGVCHRDLKPENLLLADIDDDSVLKIADFGLSALFTMEGDDAEGNGNGSNVHEMKRDEGLGGCGSPAASAAANAMRRLKSVVGSPHYVAPEILNDNGNGYDGARADVWSLGVILYAMLAGNLPFGKDLLHCMRFSKFRKWIQWRKQCGKNIVDVEYPAWFFAPQFSPEVSHTSHTRTSYGRIFLIFSCDFSCLTLGKVVVE